jgi:hypothetical protein
MTRIVLQQNLVPIQKQKKFDPLSRCAKASALAKINALKMEDAGDKRPRENSLYQNSIALCTNPTPLLG